jgi:ATP-dependent 26S proteasome regulatory subunit
VSLKQKIVENKEKVKKTMQLPYLVSNIVEIVDPTEEDQQEDGATADMDAARKSKAVVIKTTTRQVQIACYFSRPSISL